VDQIIAVLQNNALGLSAAFAQPDPARDVKFYFPQYRLIEIPDEPITEAINDSTWQQHLYQHLGFDDQSCLVNGFAYNNALRGGPAPEKWTPCLHLSNRLKGLRADIAEV
jgi:hypothetical protein